MKNIKKFQIFNILLIFSIFIINFDISQCSIPRKHKHPGSSQSGNSNIEIEPLKDEENINNNNVQKSQIDSNSKENINTNDKNNYKNIPPQTPYNEDDEFVYSKKDDDILNLDQEIEKGQYVPPKPRKIQNPNEKITNQGSNNINPDIQRRIKEQQERFNNIHNKPDGPRMPPNYPGGPGQPQPDTYRTGIDENGQPYTYTSGEGPHSKYQNQDKDGNTRTNVSKTRKALGLLYQLIMVFFLVSFVYNYFLGKNQNDKHALVWYNANKDYFEERYEYFGLEDDEKLTKKIPRNNFIKNCKLSKENPYYYKLTCANYRYINYLTVVLEFKKRYDVTSIISSIFITHKDRIVFQVSFQPNNNLGWIFCVCKKKKAESIKKSYEDLNYFCQIYQPSSFNNYMALISESLEVFMELFDNKSLFHYYKDVEDYLDAIYFSDMLNIDVEGTNIFFSFSIDLTKPKQEKILLEITHFVNLFVDTLAQLKYSSKFKEETKKRRIMYERTKMDPSKKKEIEDKEEKDFIEKWRLIRKIKTKKGAEKRKLERQLKNFQ